jgi:hypothetical protein
MYAPVAGSQSSITVFRASDGAQCGSLRLSGGYGVDLADGRDAVGEPFNVAEIAAPSTVSSTVTT